MGVSVCGGVCGCVRESFKFQFALEDLPQGRGSEQSPEGRKGSMEKMVPEKGIANAKVLRQELVWHV